MSCTKPSCSSNSGCTTYLKKILDTLCQFFNFASLRFFDGVTSYSTLLLGPAGLIINSKASMLEDFQIYNNDTTPTFVDFYNTAVLPVIATDIPVIRILVPAKSGANVGLLKKYFTIGLSVRAKKGAADTDVVAPPADTLLFNIGYRSL